MLVYLGLLLSFDWWCHSTNTSPVRDDRRYHKRFPSQREELSRSTVLYSTLLYILPWKVAGAGSLLDNKAVSHCSSLQQQSFDQTGLSA